MFVDVVLCVVVCCWLSLVRCLLFVVDGCSAFCDVL